MKKEITIKKLKEEESNPMDEIMKRVFQPYDNLIDWALNRRTNDGYKEEQADRT